MKAEDLMVGDILQNENTDYVLIRSVANTAEKDFCIVEILDGAHQGDIQRVYCEDLIPIHLTPDILEKNGWVLKEWNCHKQFQYIAEECNDEIIYKIDYIVPHFIVSCFRSNIEIMYVHELQHALRLCEIDKKIVL